MVGAGNVHVVPVLALAATQVERQKLSGREQRLLVAMPEELELYLSTWRLCRTPELQVFLVQLARTGRLMLQHQLAKLVHQRLNPEIQCLDCVWAIAFTVDLR